MFPERQRCILTCIITTVLILSGSMSDSRPTSVAVRHMDASLDGVRLPIPDDVLRTRLPWRAVVSSFTGTRKGSFVQLEWSTTTEVNHRGFEVQRASSSSRGWERLAFVPGFGSSSMEQHYYFDDRRAPPEDLRYMLRVLSNDNMIQYSQIITVPAGSLLRSLTVSGPIDLYGKVYQAEIELSEKSEITLHLLDQVGNVLLRTLNAESLPRGKNVIPIDCSKLPSGLYQLLAYTPDNRFSRTLTVK